MMKLSEDEKWLFRPLTFGYGVFEIIKVEGKKRPSRKIVFHSSNKDQALRAFEDFVDKGQTDLVPEDNFLPLLFKVKFKYGFSHYLVHSIEELDKICLDVFKERANRFLIWDIPNEELIDNKYIESCPDEDIKREMIKKNKQITEKVKAYKKHNWLVETIDKKIIENDPTNCYNIFTNYEGAELVCHNHELIQFNNIKY